MIEEYSLLGLFFSAFISSTLFPGGSEVVLLYLASQDNANFLLLWVVASLGNTLGGMTSWLLGYYLAIRFPKRTLDEEKHGRALNHIRRWGSVGLIFSWLPVIGDPLCLAAGWLKVSIIWSLLFIALGKAMRYGVILLVL